MLITRQNVVPIQTTSARFILTSIYSMNATVKKRQRAYKEVSQLYRFLNVKVSCICFAAESEKVHQVSIDANTSITQTQLSIRKFAVAASAPLRLCVCRCYCSVVTPSGESAVQGPSQECRPTRAPNGKSHLHFIIL